jgi:hypothetical protein
MVNGLAMPSEPKITLSHQSRGVPVVIVQFVCKMGCPFFDHHMIKALAEHFDLE